jgi:hypothetical protein
MWELLVWISSGGRHLFQIISGVEFTNGYVALLAFDFRMSARHRPAYLITTAGIDTFHFE